jgi:hypothetical protein
MAFRDIAFRRLEQFRSAQLRVTGRESAWNIVDVIEQNDQPEPPGRGPGGRCTDLDSAIKTLAAVATLAKIAYDECQIWKARCTSGLMSAASTPAAPTAGAATHAAPHAAPTPGAATPVAPTPIAATHAASTPVAPTPAASTPVAPTPVAATHAAVHLDETQFFELANATMGEIEIRWPLPKSDLPNDATEIVRETIQDATRELDGAGTSETSSSPVIFR